MSIRYLRTVRLSSAEGLVRATYDQIRHEFGVLGEPLLVHSPIPTLLAAVWCCCREAILVGEVRREQKESIAVAVSRLNECPYCVDAHSVLLRALAAHEAAGAIQYGRADTLADTGFRVIARWAAATNTPGAPALRERPFQPRQVPEIIGTAFWIHYINRIAAVFLNRRLIRVPAGLASLRAAIERIGGAYFAETVARKRVPGASLPLLAGVRSAPQPAWATGVPSIAAAFGAWAAASEDAGTAALTAETRAWATASINAWTGERPGVGRGWLDQRLLDLDPRLHDEGRLPLLAAIAPYQVDDQIVSEFRRVRQQDAEVLGAVAWGAFRAAERIASWL
jgi:AhpD family alkylhydroperoxidase